MYGILFMSPAAWLDMKHRERGLVLSIFIIYAKYDFCLCLLVFSV